MAVERPALDQLEIEARPILEESTHRLGSKVNRTHIPAYVTAGVLTFFGSLLLMTQIGVDDPTQGISYALSSITAVVLGGTGLLAGRGSFIAPCWAPL